MIRSTRKALARQPSRFGPWALPATVGGALMASDHGIPGFKAPSEYCTSMGLLSRTVMSATTGMASPQSTLITKVTPSFGSSGGPWGAMSETQTLASPTKRG
jgi:hypothetical protein